MLISDIYRFVDARVFLQVFVKISAVKFCRSKIYVRISLFPSIRYIIIIAHYLDPLTDRYEHEIGYIEKAVCAEKTNDGQNSKFIFSFSF